MSVALATLIQMQGAEEGFRRPRWQPIQLQEIQYLLWDPRLERLDDVDNERPICPSPIYQEGVIMGDKDDKDDRVMISSDTVCILRANLPPSRPRG